MSLEIPRDYFFFSSVDVFLRTGWENKYQRRVKSLKLLMLLSMMLMSNVVVVFVVDIKCYCC